MDILDLELAAILLGTWFASLIVLWKAVDRPARAGLIRNGVVVDVMMLASLACLVSGMSFLIKGSGIFG